MSLTTERLRAAGVSAARGTPRLLVGGLAAAAVSRRCFFSAGGDVLNNMVLAAAYVVMALGLNLIVGFAGLLDLGYVAFFAIGAYTAAYFGSGFWANAGSGGAASRSWPATPRPAAGIHLNFLLVLVARRRGDGGRGHADRRADAAPARRLHRGRHAGVRRDHRRRSRPTAAASRSSAAR